MRRQNNKTVVPESPVTFREIAKHLSIAQDNEPSYPVRNNVLSDFKNKGGIYDRWNKNDSLLMLDSLITHEDVIELLNVSKNREVARLTLRKIRRRLEAWLFP